MERVLKQLCNCCFEYRTLNGCNNNLTNPDWGKADQPFLRLVPPDYTVGTDGADGLAGPDRCSARVASNLIFAQDQPIPNKKCASNMFWLWGQFIDHDLVLTLTGTDCEDITVSSDPVFTEDLSFKRSIFDPMSSPREQINSISAFLDGTNVYGTTKERNDFLRTFCKGKLKLSEGGLLPFNDGNYENAGGNVWFVAGDIRCNEHIGLASMHTLFAREHNYWAEQICKKCPCLCDEEIYQRAKLMVESEIQAITYNEFLPLLLGCCSLNKYNGYDSSINPQIYNMFATAAYRFGHSMVASKIFKCKNLKLKDIFFSSYHICNSGGIDNILRNFACTISEELDAKVIDDLRNFLFGTGPAGHDLVSLNIQRGRDHGLPDYNTVRCALGLPKITAFSDLSSDQKIIDGLQECYGDVDNIDLFVGGLLEKHKCGSMLGPLFHKIVKIQFQRIRNADRLWYERRLTCEQVKFVNNLKLSDVIKRNTCIKDIQKCVFISPKNKCCHCCKH